MRNADCSIKTIATDGWRDLGSKALKAYCSWEEIVSLFMVCHAKLGEYLGLGIGSCFFVFFFYMFLILNIDQYQNGTNRAIPN